MVNRAESQILLLVSIFRELQTPGQGVQTASLEKYINHSTVLHLESNKSGPQNSKHMKSAQREESEVKANSSSVCSTERTGGFVLDLGRKSVRFLCQMQRTSTNRRKRASTARSGLNLRQGRALPQTPTVKTISKNWRWPNKHLV